MEYYKIILSIIDKYGCDYDFDDVVDFLDLSFKRLYGGIISVIRKQQKYPFEVIINGKKYLSKKVTQANINNVGINYDKDLDRRRVIKPDQLIEFGKDAIIYSDMGAILNMKDKNEIERFRKAYTVDKLKSIRDATNVAINMFIYYTSLISANPVRKALAELDELANVIKDKLIELYVSEDAAKELSKLTNKEAEIRKMLLTLKEREIILSTSLAEGSQVAIDEKRKLLDGIRVRIETLEKELVDVNNKRDNIKKLSEQEKIFTPETLEKLKKEGKKRKDVTDKITSFLKK